MTTGPDQQPDVPGGSSFSTVPIDPDAPASDVSATYGRGGNQVVDAVDEGSAQALGGDAGAPAAAASATGDQLGGPPTSDVSATYGRDGNQVVDATPDVAGTGRG